MKKVLLKSLAVLIAIFFAFEAITAQTLIPKMDSKKSLWGYVDSNDKWVIKPKYETASEFKSCPNGKLRAEVSLKGKQGFLDEKGKPLGAGIVFEQITPLEGNAMFVTVNGKKGVADYDGVYLVKPEAETVEQLGNEGWIMTIKGKKGLLKNDGSFLIEPNYTDIDVSVPEYFIVNAGGKAGLMKRDGKLVVAPKDFTRIAPLKDKYWTIHKNEKTGLMDIASGNIIFKPQYDSVTGVYLNGKVYIVKKGDKTDILNEYGNRRHRFSGYDNIILTELPEHEALLIDLGEENSFIYCVSNAVAKPIKFSVENFHGYRKNKGELAKNVEYTESDKEALAPFLRSDEFYTSPSGEETKYRFGKNISASLYVLTKISDGVIEDYIFKQGQREPIGVADGNINPGNYVFKLTDGSYIDTNGDPVEIIEMTISRGQEIIKIKNLTTGKYTIACDKNGKFESLSAIEFDVLKSLDNGVYGYDPFFYGKVGNHPYLFDLAGTVKEFDSNEYVDLRGGIIVDRDGNMGLKSEDKLVLEPGAYDKITKVNSYYAVRNDDHDWALFDSQKKKFVIPFEKGYEYMGGTDELFDAGLCIVGDYPKNGAKGSKGVWNLQLGKEIMKPSPDNDISYLPKGYKGFKNNGVAYDTSGRKLSLPAAVDVYESQWANKRAYFFTKLVGLEGRKIVFYITVYNENGTIYTDRSGEKVIFEVVDATPTSAVEYGPTVSEYRIFDTIYLTPFSSKNLKFVLSAKDAKTGASIPVKGEKSVSATFSRDW